MNKILEDPQFKLFLNPINFLDFEAIGYYPYGVTRLPDLVAVPKSLLNDILYILKLNDIDVENKSVVVFKDKVNFGTENFCIYFKDAYCKIGKLEEIIKN